jgi:hypothetical protein
MRTVGIPEYILVSEPVFINFEYGNTPGLYSCPCQGVVCKDCIIHLPVYLPAFFRLAKTHPDHFMIWLIMHPRIFRTQRQEADQVIIPVLNDEPCFSPEAFPEIVPSNLDDSVNTSRFDSSGRQLKQSIGLVFPGPDQPSPVS